MTEPKPSFIQRLGLAWRTLIDATFAARLERVARGEVPPAAIPKPAPALKATEPQSALQLLGLLQQEGRFVDFLQEDVSGFADAEIGGAARVVHEGCRKALMEHFTLEPIRGEAEGNRVTLQEGFDASAIRLAGNVVGSAPFTGTLIHRGWRVAEVRLPRISEGHNVRVVAPAEVEL